eukprot:9483919-Pyramimonas_sp.AAC.1
MEVYVEQIDELKKEREVTKRRPPGPVAYWGVNEPRVMIGGGHPPTPPPPSRGVPHPVARSAGERAGEGGGGHRGGGADHYPGGGRRAARPLRGGGRDGGGHGCRDALPAAPARRDPRHGAGRRRPRGAGERGGVARGALMGGCCEGDVATRNRVALPSLEVGQHVGQKKNAPGDSRLESYPMPAGAGGGVQAERGPAGMQAGQAGQRGAGGPAGGHEAEAGRVLPAGGEGPQHGVQGRHRQEQHPGARGRHGLRRQGGAAGACANQTQESRVYSHGGPIRRRMHGYVAPTQPTDSGSKSS